MTLETTSLALSKRLAALGVPQKSEFFRSDDVDGLYWSERHIQTGEDISVWTSGELGKMLPWEIEGRILCTAKSSDGSWATYYEKNNLGFPMNQKTRIDDQSGSNGAESHGLMLEYLLLNGLIKVTDLQV